MRTFQLASVSFVVVATLSSPLHAATRGPCATTALRDLPALAAATTGILDRPDTVTDVIAHPMLPLRVHHAGAPLLAAATLDELARAWALQIDGAGYPPPLADDVGFGDAGGDAGLDLYLAPLPRGVGAVTVSGDDVDDVASRDVRPTFIVIDPTQPADTVAAATHHEFQHALQFAIDARESVMWFEATAVAFEVRGRPDVTSWHDAVPVFQRQPHAPITADGLAFAAFGTEDDLRLEYGAGLFALFLDDAFGAGDGVVLRELWQAAAGHVDNAAPVDDDNAPDWVSVVPSVLGVSWARLLVDFAAWRALAPPLTVPGEGPAAYALPGTTTLSGQRVVLERLSGVPRVPSEREGPYVAGCHVSSASHPDNATSTPLFLRARSEVGHPLGATIVVVNAGVVTTVDVLGAANEAIALDTTIEPGAEVVVAVCDVADVDADADPVYAPISLALGREPIVGEGEDEGEGEGEGEGEVCEPPLDCGCACDSTSTGPAAGDPRSMRQGLMVMGFFVGVLGFVIKAVRHRRRQRLYRKPPSA